MSCDDLDETIKKDLENLQTKLFIREHMSPKRTTCRLALILVGAALRLLTGQEVEADLLSNYVHNGQQSIVRQC